MAKIGMGGLDGFQGKVGPVVGYRWNGKMVYARTSQDDA